MMNNKTKLVKEAKNDKASRCCWSAYQKKIRQNGIRWNAIRRNATQPNFYETEARWWIISPWGRKSLDALTSLVSYFYLTATQSEI